MPIYRAAGAAIRKRAQAKWKAASEQTNATLEEKPSKERNSRDELAKKEEEIHSQTQMRWKTASAAVSFSSNLKSIDKQKKLAKKGEAFEQRAKEDKSAEVDSEVPTLDKERRKRLNQLLIDMYAGDFSQDMEMLLLLLDEVQIGEQNLMRCKEKLVKNETNNVRMLFKQGYEKLRRKQRKGRKGRKVFEKERE